ncbi:hypothetical protein PGTUg99_030048 [Puccinia graminis f. sp. tritici]|uniref:Uncharacterized protein n=1 Tax=Puccinia graminis f. sp. tritici TaxID=56615 RepID=A0A5B0SJT9_PUCGR|nr:hypothetical protein PGTUg99_030048 [Puccinia graminis f. sp. tritici]
MTNILTRHSTQHTEDTDNQSPHRPSTHHTINLVMQTSTPPVHLDVPVAGSRGTAPGQHPPQIRASQAHAPPQIKGHPWDVLVEHPRDVPPMHPTAVLEVFQGCPLKDFTSAGF